MMLDKLKNAWKSRTVWVSTVLSVLTAVQASLFNLEPVMDAKAFGWLSFALALALVWLRFDTDKSLSDK